jgi:hypothetical protein
MKIFLKSIFLVIICLSLIACSTQILNTPSNSQPNSTVSTTTENSLKTEELAQNLSTIITEDNFTWGGFGGGSVWLEWVDEDHVLLYTYRNDYSGSSSGCRIYSYSISEKTTHKICDINSTDIDSFKDNTGVYVINSTPNKHKLYKIDFNKNSATTNEIEPYMGEISKEGNIATIYNETSTVTIKNFINTDSEKAVFELKENFKFESWSPDGKYISFKNENDGIFLIYDKKGELIKEINCDNIYWCETSGFIGVYRIDTLTWTLVDLKTDEKTTLPNYSNSDIIILEPNFSLVRTYSSENPLKIIYHKTNEEININIADGSYLSQAKADYNTSSNSIILACTFEKDSETPEKWLNAYLISFNK